LFRERLNKVVDGVVASVDLIADLLRPTVEALGLELWGIEHLSRGRSALLRIYIDSESGITIDDCERVSRQVSGILDVEDPLSGEYTLEVSSPGLDRPLFTIGQFERYIGEVVSLRLRAPIDGRRKFKGVLEKVEADQITLTVDGGMIDIPFPQMEKANIAL
jgi:ribosome maturation factor RimP